ncbi:DUF3159 domain-containing protein [Microbacterium sp.]|uniref:DUF3159 domain-containing protein n=1 Tax=Microbacterium sp. TaxID=51671 RepID=UPI003A89AC8B
MNDETGEQPESPSASAALGEALSKAARRAGLDPDSGASTGQVVWRAIGGVRGIAESVVPTLLFVILFSLTRDLLVAVIASVAAALVFTVLRLVVRQPFGAAVGGLIGALIAAGWALATGSAVDAFLWGLIVNAAYGLALLITVVVGWPLVGLVAGFLMGEGTRWRADRRRRRVFGWLTLAWAGLFALRLGVQVPFYLGDDVEALGTWKLVLGIPPFALLLAATWWIVRRMYADRTTTEAERTP